MHGRFALAARWPVARGVGEEAHGKMATGKRRTINEPRLSKGTRGLFECRAVQVISIRKDHTFFQWRCRQLHCSYGRPPLI